MNEHPDRWRALALISLVELACMSLWFGVSSVVPALEAELGLSEVAASGLTVAVQLGFVAGTLVSALFNLSDIISTRKLLAISAFAGALFNGLFAVMPEIPAVALALRFLTGMALAGIYPPGMKLMATWFRSGRGLALGVLVGALTLGKASPYLVNWIGSSWRVTIVVASVSSVIGGLIVLVLIREGPLSVGTAPFDPRQVLTILRTRGVRLANYGYFGHMWELYAMWTWLPFMLRASFEQSGAPVGLAEIGSFLVIGSGAAGCVVAGAIADRVGRTIVTSVAMGISGTCCVVIGLLYGGSPMILLVVATIWAQRSSPIRHNSRRVSPSSATHATSGLL